jgi:DNA-binding response OmpR family regulator
MSQKSTKWIVEFEARAMREPRQVSFQDTIIIGRGGPNNPVDLDLSPYQAIEKGVSRQHVMISAEADRLYVVDLNAPNGTMLNGQRLQPNKRYPLTGEDEELVLGAMHISLRVITAPTQTNDGQRQTDIDYTGEKKPGHGESVLIIEDHMEVAQMFSMMLQHQGFLTQIARDGNRTADLLKESHPHAIILDLMLPGPDGFEVCRYIRQDTALDAVPVIVVSAQIEAGIEERVQAAGADIFMAKPVNTSELGEVVSAMIQRRRQQAGLPAKIHMDKDVTQALDATRADLKARSIPVREDTVAIIVAGYTDQPFTVSLKHPMTMGRAGGNNPANHINLADFGAGDMGVSRVHAILSYSDGSFFVEDAGSLNGTYLGGQPIAPHRAKQLYSGQEIRLGQLSLNVYFLNKLEPTPKPKRRPKSETDHTAPITDPGQTAIMTDPDDTAPDPGQTAIITDPDEGDE